MRFLFTADLHGNEFQYNKVFQYVKEQHIELLVLGGDLSPKDKEKRNPTSQKDFFQNILFPLPKTSNAKTLLILGNDDYRTNLNFLKENETMCNYKIIDTPYYFNEYCFIGYSYVPHTPFIWKDWEKRDLTSDTEKDLREDVLTVGKIDFDKSYDILQNYLKSSIEDDLDKLCKDIPSNKLILITHAPPFETVCDLTKDKAGKLRHIGSRAVRKIIESKKPLLTLHGHIHDSVVNSGDFMQKIGETISATVGNEHLTEDVFALDIYIDEQITINRVRL